MGDPRDRLDAWLNAEIEPLAPPPGTFQRITGRARRRKTGRAVMSAAGIVVVIAAAVAVPRVATVLESHRGGPGHPVVAGGPTPTVRPSASGHGNGTESATSTTPEPTGPASLSPGGSRAPVPRNFQPTSVTFVGPHTGVVIGQAGTPGHCPIIAADCTSLAGTSDYGSSWYGVSAPVTGAPDGSRGVGQIRFLNTRDGWAFGPELWVTHDGGAHWTRQQTYGMRVTDLETAGDRAFAIFASCAGTGPAYAARCSSVALYSSAADGTTWQPVPGLPARLAPPASGATAAASASLVLVGGAGGGAGYLLAPSGELFSGPLTGGPWRAADPVLPCPPGPPGAEGQPSGALLAADANQLVLVCTTATSGDTQPKSVLASTDGGARWATAGAAPAAGIATSVAIQPQGSVLLLATNAGLYRSGDGGRSWLRTQASPGGAAAGQAGFSYVGMTSPTNGVALPADAGLHQVYITTDGGSTWQPEAVSAP